MKLYIMSGIPGAGKSTWIANNVEQSAPVCSADHHFLDRVTGEYKFDFRQLAAAHSECFNKFKANLDNLVNTIVVDNTNTTWGQCARYVEAGLSAGYEVVVVRLVVDPSVAAARNVHAVPAASVATMASRQLVIPQDIKNNPKFSMVTVESK